MAQRPLSQGDQLTRAADIARFSEVIGHDFKDVGLLEEALTHASFNSAVSRDNQRMEFLGDRVLGLVVAGKLLDDDPDAVEGILAPRLNAMVRKEACAEIAAEIGLGVLMRMGRSEMQSGGRRKTAILGDAMEAVIAAVFIDGGFDAARHMILRLWQDKFSQAPQLSGDPKTELQEWAQARKMQPPEYKEKSRRGPDHAPLFVVEARLENGLHAEAEARSKRAAQQSAAEQLLQSIKDQI